jgi:hypothetical protein
MENKKHIMTKEWYEKIANSDLAKRYNPKQSFEDHVKMKAEYLKKREQYTKKAQQRRGGILEIYEKVVCSYCAVDHTHEEAKECVDCSEFTVCPKCGKCHECLEVIPVEIRVQN